jgi:hypothetical protein
MTERYARVPEGVIFRLCSSHFKVWVALAIFADTSGICFPSLELVAEKANLTVDWVQRVVKDLIRLGEVEIRPGGRFYLPALADLSNAGDPDDCPEPSDECPAIPYIEQTKEQKIPTTPPLPPADAGKIAPEPEPQPPKGLGKGKALDGEILDGAVVNPGWRPPPDLWERGKALRGDLDLDAFTRKFVQKNLNKRLTDIALVWWIWLTREWKTNARPTSRSRPTAAAGQTGGPWRKPQHGADVRNIRCVLSTALAQPIDISPG